MKKISVFFIVGMLAVCCLPGCTGGVRTDVSNSDVSDSKEIVSSVVSDVSLPESSVAVEPDASLIHEKNSKTKTYAFLNKVSELNENSNVMLQIDMHMGESQGKITMIYTKDILGYRDDFIDEQSVGTMVYWTKGVCYNVDTVAKTYFVNKADTASDDPALSVAMDMISHSFLGIFDVMQYSGDKDGCEYFMYNDSRADDAYVKIDGDTFCMYHGSADSDDYFAIEIKHGVSDDIKKLFTVAGCTEIKDTEVVESSADSVSDHS